MSWSTSELRVRLAPWNRFKPSSKIFLLTVPRWYFFCGYSCYFWCVFVMFSRESIYCCLVVTCWERADLLDLVCDVLLWVCYFPIGILVLDCIDSWSLPSFVLLNGWKSCKYSFVSRNVFKRQAMNIVNIHTLFACAWPLLQSMDNLRQQCVPKSAPIKHRADLDPNWLALW